MEFRTTADLPAETRIGPVPGGCFVLQYKVEVRAAICTRTWCPDRYGESRDLRQKSVAFQHRALLRHIVFQRRPRGDPLCSLVKGAVDACRRESRHHVLSRPTALSSLCHRARLHTPWAAASRATPRLRAPLHHGGQTCPRTRAPRDSPRKHLAASGRPCQCNRCRLCSRASLDAPSTCWGALRASSAGWARTRPVATGPYLCGAHAAPGGSAGRDGGGACALTRFRLLNPPLQRSVSALRPGPDDAPLAHGAHDGVCAHARARERVCVSVCVRERPADEDRRRLA